LKLGNQRTQLGTKDYELQDRRWQRLERPPAPLKPVQSWFDKRTLALARSDLASAVYEAVIAAGLSFPFPQREVRLLRDPATDSNGDILKPAGKSSTRSEENESS
jgi:hypothetical protein